MSGAWESASLPGHILSSPEFSSPAPREKLVATPLASKDVMGLPKRQNGFKLGM